MRSWLADRGACARVILASARSLILAGAVSGSTLLSCAAAAEEQKGQLRSGVTARVKLANANDIRVLPGDLLFLNRVQIAASNPQGVAGFSRKLGIFVLDMEPDKPFPDHDVMATADIVVSLHRRF